MEKTYLVLQNGAIFEGQALGFTQEVLGRITFNTGMNGYLEALTDKSSYGNIIIQAFPSIGNYGVISQDFEGEKVYARALVVGEICDKPSNFRSQCSLIEFAKKHNFLILCAISTRALVKTIRKEGMLNAIITQNPQSVDLKALSEFKEENAIEQLSVQDEVAFEFEDSKGKLVLWDFGFKNSTMNELVERGYNVTIAKHSATSAHILDLKPNAVVIAGGAGDPKSYGTQIKEINKLLKSNLAVLGIGLGHQLIALAKGFNTYQLKQAHFGLNQPVKDLTSGRIHITSQNHSFAVQESSVENKLAQVWFKNVNDGTNEGLLYSDCRAMSVQFYPQAADAVYDKFFNLIEEA